MPRSRASLDASPDRREASTKNPTWMFCEGSSRVTSRVTLQDMLRDYYKRLPEPAPSAPLAPPGTGRSPHERRNIWSVPRNPAGSLSGWERERDVRGPSASPGVAGTHPGLPARAEGGGRGGQTGRAAARRLLTPAAFARLGRRPTQAGKPRGSLRPRPPERCLPRGRQNKGLGFSLPAPVGEGVPGLDSGPAGALPGPCGMWKQQRRRANKDIEGPCSGFWLRGA
ncbi:hypothetical protein NDU88_004312 [Pleurodeles waltl]|uniref:Uncharacterized protein n=1 Tax=Pleurodeles waltl TaxID=8319 RepID=A0AAV7UEP8_PLEWA|nr:hypothetical protein NDU88_004312 [Pleurodeles waltl]